MFRELSWARETVAHPPRARGAGARRLRRVEQVELDELVDVDERFDLGGVLFGREPDDRDERHRSGQHHHEHVVGVDLVLDQQTRSRPWVSRPRRLPTRPARRRAQDRTRACRRHSPCVPAASSAHPT